MQSHYANIIIGAGPAGLQLGYFFQKAGLDYIILERAPIAASFFDRYPHSGKLISINKKYTGSDVYDFNLRHDWNSLLNDEKMSFTSYSEDYYPAKEELVRYMNDFAARFKLRIQYNSSVSEVSTRANNGYSIKLTRNNSSYTVTCNKLIVATGLSKPNIPRYVDETTVKPKHYAEFPKDYFKKKENLDLYRNKSVLIYGSGNSAFELGNLLTPYCSKVVVQGRTPKVWSASSHYTGDFRSIYAPFIDTFLLKSLNVFNYSTGLPIITQGGADSQYILREFCTSPICRVKHDMLTHNRFDHVIFATGWTFDASIFKTEINVSHNGKFPSIHANYESISHPNLFFIGALMHSRDYKMSSGGFIHGFRYLIEYFFHMNYDKQFDIDSFVKSDIDALVDHIIYKLNYTSPMYQMYGQLGDFFYYDASKQSIVYYNNVTKGFINNYVEANPSNTYFNICLEYGKDYIYDTRKFGSKNSDIGTEGASVLIHPVIKVFRPLDILKGDLVGASTNGITTKIVDAIHMDEDVFADFSSKQRYGDRIARFLKGYLA
jgi:thioredoxin reductase